MERFMLKQAADVITVVAHKDIAITAVRPSNVSSREPHCP
jgi:hypothetical protein